MSDDHLIPSLTSQDTVSTWLDGLTSDRDELRLPRQALEHLRTRVGRMSEGLEQTVFFCLYSEFMGHTCLPLDLAPSEWARLMEFESAALSTTPLDRTALALEIKRLNTSENPFPFRLEGDRIALDRLAWMEDRVAERLRRMAAPNVDSNQTSSALDARFKAVLDALTPPATNGSGTATSGPSTATSGPSTATVGSGPSASESSAEHPPDEPESALLAASLLLDRNLVLLTGGPGTGKTTAVAGILTSWLLTCQRPLRIAFTAPTGKAASRLTESLQARLPFWLDRLRQRSPELSSQMDALLETVDLTAMTLHRFIEGAREKGLLPAPIASTLPYDLVIVDEASMMDLDLFHTLLHHLEENCKLILVGDPDQLGSVDAGAVLRDLSRKTQQVFSPLTAARLDALHASHLHRSDQIDKVSDCHILLSRSHRFGQEGGIGRLASWITSPKTDSTPFAGATFSGVSGDSLPTGELVHIPLPATYPRPDPFSDLLASAISDCRMHPSSQWLEYWRGMIWLTPLRHGPYGSMELNRRVLARFRGRHPFPEGCPVIVTRNDYSLGVFNGDIGVCMVQNGRGMVAFEGGAHRSSEMRLLPLSSLSSLEPALFLTVHKSQGSEFDHVHLILPPEDSPIVDRSLLFTALTRARSRFTLHGDLDRFLSLCRVQRPRFTMLGSTLSKL